MSRRPRARLAIALFVFMAGALIDLTWPCSGSAYCTGDCDVNGSVSSSEAIDCRGIAFGSRPLSECRRCDCDENGIVSDDELMKAEQNVINGCNASECPAATATPGITPTRTATRTPAEPSATPTTPRATRTAVASATPSAGVTVTAIPGACVGDCDANHKVVVNELVTGVNIALERSPASTCAPFDGNQSSTVSIDELVQGVNNLLHGCP